MKKLSFLEDPENPSLGPVIKFFRITFMWAPNRSKLGTTIYYSVVLVTLLLGINELIYTGCLLKPEMFFAILQFSVYHIGVLKLLSYEIYRDKWEKIIQYIADIEKDLKDDETCKEAFQKYIKYVRTVIVFFFPMCTAANINLFGKSWLLVINETEAGDVNGTHTKVFYFYWPFKEEGRLARYMDMFMQNFYGDTTSVYVLAWDCLVISLMVVFAGQLEVIRIRFMHALDTDDEEEQKRNLTNCHQHYLSLLEHQALCNSLLSPVMFIYLLLASSNLAVTILRMFSYNRAELMAAVQFLGALMTQLLFFYWHSNEVTVQSERVSYGVFSSAWWRARRHVQRQVALLSVASTKRLVFTAGPFNEISLATFVSILRGSYSFFTLMNQTN